MPSRHRHRQDQRRATGSTQPQGTDTGPPRDGPPVRRATTPVGHTAPRPASTPRRITTPDEAAALAAHLLDPGRTHPVVVVSIPHGLTDPWIEASTIADAVKELADVVVLPTDASSWRFSEAMPDMTQVYGGAGRVYPIDPAWTHNPYASPLRFAYDAAEGERSTDTLISDALRMAHDAGLVAPERTTTVPAVGVVRRVLAPSRAMVQLDDGGIATVWQELTAPDVPVDNLLAPGMTVHGELDPDSRRLDVTGMLQSGRGAIAHYQPHDVVLAKVTEVRPDVVHLALHPDVVVAVPKGRVTGNPKDALTGLFSVGEVVVARVARTGADGLALRLDDLDEDEEPLPAPALLDGGPAWLDAPSYPELLEEPVPEEPSVVAPAPLPAPAPSPTLEPPPMPRGAARDLSLTLDAARAVTARLERDLVDATARLGPAEHEVAGLRRQMQDLLAERQRLREQIVRQKTQLRTRVQSAAKAKRSAASPAQDFIAPVFDDPDEAFRHQVNLAWEARFPAAEKAERPLAGYRIGPEFLASLEAVEGVQRSKVVNVVVEVLTGRAAELAGRGLHPLRTGRSGDDPQVQRDDGALAWRVALQRGAPSARRLHFWQLGEVIELSRVAVHDEMRP